jgi:hypothetical protein
VPFCPRCRSEYNVGVEQCIDCHVPLVLHRPRRRALVDVDTDELLVPLGALLCLVMSLALFGVTNMARAGQLEEPLATMISQQPICLTVFYAIGAIASGLVLAISVLRWLFFRG